MSRYAQGPGEWERDETPGERLDRNWGELLQELRVTQTGIQILSGFLLILPFQSCFEELTADLLTIYLCAVLFGTLAIALIVAPVTAHRIFFRLLVKDRLVLWGDRMAKAGLFCFAVTVGLVVALVIGFLLGISTGIIAGIVAFLVFALLWVVLPLMVVRRADGPE